MKSARGISFSYMASVTFVMLLLTGVGLSQTFIFKNPSYDYATVWFPLAILVKRWSGSDFAMLVAAASQFLILGGVFCMFRSKMSFGFGVVIVMSIYCLLLFGALLFK